MNRNSKNDLILLLGEKGGDQARDNGFCYFEYRMKNGYKNTYFIYTNDNIDLKKISKYKSNIILKNSKKHNDLFYKADYLLLNDGYMDVFPTIKKSPLSKGWSPIIYLQHGITSYKKVHFCKGHYNGRIRYFLTCLKSENNITSNTLQSKKDLNETKKIITKNKIAYFKSYNSKDKLIYFYSMLLKKFYTDSTKVDAEDIQSLKKLITSIGFLDSRNVNAGFSRHIKLPLIKKTNKNILFFFTWREAWTKNNSENGFLELVKKIKSSKNILEYAECKNLDITFYLHEKILHLKEEINALFGNNVKLVGQNDFTEVLRDSAICITDYSSVSFEFNIINTPVVFLQFDYDQYKYERGHFLESPNDFNGIVINKISELDELFTQYNIEEKLIKSASINYKKVIGEYENFGETNKIIDALVQSKQKHIIYFCYNIYGIGGTVQTVINQANHLVQEGYQVSIISLRRTAEAPKLLLDPSVRLEYLNDVRCKGKFRGKIENHLAQYPSFLFHKTEDNYAGMSLLSDLKLVKIIKTISNSTLVGTTPGLCFNLLKRANNSNTVIVQEHKEFSSHSDKIKKNILKIYKKAKRIIVLTKFQKEEYFAQGLKKICSIPNGIEDKLDFIANNSLLSRPKRIVSFGRLVKVKQFNLLIEAFSYISSNHPEWRLDIYGDGEEKETLLKMITDLNLSEKVTIHKPTSLVYEEIYNSAFCALTASNEPFGMVYIESFSMAKPVVSFDIGYGPKEFLVDGYNSLIAPCFDTKELSKKMERLMNDEELLDNLGSGARQTYIKNYEISKVMNNFLKEIQQ